MTGIPFNPLFASTLLPSLVPFLGGQLMVSISVVLES